MLRPSLSAGGGVPASSQKVGSTSQKAPMKSLVVARLDPARPAGEEGRADAPFVEVFLVAAEVAIAAEELRIGAAERKDRAIIAGENHQRLVVEAEFLEQGHEPADVAVHAGDHRGISGAWRGVIGVVVGICERRLGPLAAVFRERVFGHLEREVRDGEGEVEEERIVLLTAQPSGGRRRP